MNIGYDIHPLFTNSYKTRGVGLYCKSLINEVEKIDQNNIYKFNCYDDKVEGVSQNNLKNYCIRKKMIGDFLLESDPFIRISAAQMQHFCFNNRLDIFHFLTPFSYEPASLLTIPKNTAKVTTIYDFIQLVFAEHYLPEGEFNNHYLRQIRLLSDFDAFITISNNTAKDLLYYTGVPKEKVFSINLGFNTDFKVLAEKEFPELRRMLGIENKFLFYVGGDHFTKNARDLVSAYARLDPLLISKYQLVMCGLPLERQAELNSIVDVNGKRNRVVLLPHIEQEELVQLYNMAEIFVFPSKYEGFGLPVVEAFACGTPVVTSNNSSLSDIADGCAFQVDPFSIDSISNGIKYALTHPEERKKLSEAALAKSKEMTWSNTANKTLEVYKEIVNQKKERRKTSIATRTKRSIAWFSPMPPIESGISGYSHEILAHLMNRMEIDVFIDKGYIADVPDLTKCKVYPYSAFRQMHSRQKYDVIIYQMGASSFHEYLMEFIKEFPGIVVNHDTNYHNLLRHLTNQGTQVSAYKEALSIEFGPKQGEDVFKEVRVDTNCWKKHIVNSYFLGATKQLIVLTEHNKNILLKKEIGREISVIPLHTWLPANFKYLNITETKKKHGIPLDSIIISSFGSVHESKRNLQSIEAFIRLAKKREDSYFCLVGHCERGYYEELMSVVSRNQNIKDRIIYTGRVADDDFFEYLRITDIFIGLRSEGFSTSGPLLKALGAGIPCIVSNINAFGDINNDAVIKVDIDDNEVSNIASTLERLASSEAARCELGKKAEELSQQQFSIESVVDKYENAINAYEHISQKVLLSNSDIGNLIAVFGSDINPNSELVHDFSREIAMLNQTSVEGCK